MKVAYVCADRGVPVFGRKGSSIHVQEVIRALMRRGARVELIAARVGGSPPLDFNGVNLHTLSPESAGTDAAARERASVRTNIAVRRSLEALGPVDLIYERYSLWSCSALRRAQRSGVPGVLEVNAPLVEEQAQHRVLCDRATALRIARRNFATARAVIAVSREVADWVRMFPNTAGRVHVIPNGVDPSRFAPRAWPPHADGPQRRQAETFTVGFVGTLKAWHGLPLLVDAFSELYAEHRLTRLLIVGDGPGRSALEEDLEARGLRGAAVLTGAVDPRAIPGLLSSMDVAVAPYSARQPFYFSPLKVLEYMAAGLPVVASRIGQLEELVSHDVTGLLCSPDEPPALAACIRRLRESCDLRRRLGTAAREGVVKHHTWDAVVGRSLELAGLLPSNFVPEAGWIHARTEAHA